MFCILRFALLILIIILASMLVNATVTVEGINVTYGKEDSKYLDLFECNDAVNYDRKLLRADETLNKNFTVLLHPNLTFPGTAETFIQSMRCYFGNISFQFISFNKNTTDSAICDAFDKLSSRTSKSLRPLLVIFPQSKEQQNAYDNDRINPPCSMFETIAMTIQATIEPDGFVSLFIRSKVADYVIKSLPDCSTLFDSIAAMMNPSLHNEFRFPYRPLQHSQTVPENETGKWHIAAFIGIGIGVILIFVIPGFIVWHRVKTHQKQRDEDRNLREAILLKSKMEQPNEVLKQNA